jgi:hypothetical protein
MQRRLFGGQFPALAVYGAIVLVVVVFNLVAVFGLHALLQDDQALFYGIGEGSYPWWTYQRALFLPLVHIPVLIVMHWSPALARLAVLLLFMAPISCLLYYLYTSKVGLEPLPAFAAAVLPNILPGQDLIPAFVDGSYSVYGLFFTLVAVAMACRYLEKGADAYLWLGAAVLTYFIASQLMEQSAFLFPPVAFLLAFCSSQRRKSVHIVSAFFLIAGYRTYQSLAHPFSANTVPNTLQTSEIVRRATVSFRMSTPLPAFFQDAYYPSLSTAAAIGVLVLITIVGFYLGQRCESAFRPRKAFRERSRRLFLVFLFSFFLIWFLSASTVFVSVSKYFTSRYMYLAAFGVCGALSCSVYGLLMWVLRQRKGFVAIVLVMLVAFIGYQRNEQLGRRFGELNGQQEQLVRALRWHPLPRDSQIVFFGPVSAPAVGIENWFCSSGYLRNALGRSDVQGLVATSAISFYDPFDKARRGWNYPMEGLDLDKPIFLFRKQAGSVRQYQYALQWVDAGRDMEDLGVESSWNLYCFDPVSGAARRVKSGTGYEGYIQYIHSADSPVATQEQVLWGEGALPEGRASTSPTGEGYRRVPASAAAKIVSRGGNVLARQIEFGDAFSLMSVSIDQTASGQGKRVLLLWRSNKSQKTGSYSVGYAIRDPAVTDRAMWSGRVSFLSAGDDLAQGDLVCGGITIPANIEEKYFPRGYVLRVYFLTEDPRDWSGWPKMLLKTSEGKYEVSIPLGS